MQEKINLQYFYWHIIKYFYHSEYSSDEIIHVNLDWYTLKNVYRQSPEEVRDWFEEARLDISEPQGLM